MGLGHILGVHPYHFANTSCRIVSNTCDRLDTVTAVKDTDSKQDKHLA